MYEIDNQGLQWFSPETDKWWKINNRRASQRQEVQVKLLPSYFFIK